MAGKCSLPVRKAPSPIAFHIFRWRLNCQPLDQNIALVSIALFVQSEQGQFAETAPGTGGSPSIRPLDLAQQIPNWIEYGGLVQHALPYTRPPMVESMKMFLLRNGGGDCVSKCSRKLINSEPKTGFSSGSIELTQVGGGTAFWCAAHSIIAAT
ncbi:MAG: hypothetical protein HYV26_07080 [Candidatus Hydrogenedentes bacterium]|nr:hypothetical protein [Candidatus Hydrogenedentota bacterium]